MENGVDGVDSCNLVEKAMENAAVESYELKDSEGDIRVEEEAMLGSQELKDSEGHEVFEDSSAAEIPEIHLEDVLIGPDDVVPKSKSLDRVIAVHEKNDAANDLEKFEEAMGVPNDIDDQEEQLACIEDKREILVGVEPIDKAMVGGVSNGESIMAKDGRAELDEVENIVSVSNNGGIKEIMEEGDVRGVDIAAVDLNSSDIVEKPDNGVLSELKLEGALAREILENEHGNVEEIAVEEHRTGDSQIVREAERETEVLGFLENSHPHKTSYDDEEDEDVGIHMDCVGKANHDSVALDPKLEDGKNSGGVEEETTAKPVTLHNTDTSEELKDTAGFGKENRDETIQVERALAASYSDHYHTNGKPETAMEEREEYLESKQLLTSEDIVIDRDEMVEENSSDMGVERVEVFQPQPANKSVESCENNAKEFEIKGAEVQEIRQNARGENGLGKVKLVPNASPSSGKPENSTPLPACPAGLGRAAPLFESAPRLVQQPRANGTSSQMRSQIVEDLTSGDEENDETREKLQMIRVKFLRLAHRLGQTPHNVVVAQVLYRLGLAEQLRGRNGVRVPAFSFDRASAMAEQLEAAGQETLDFSCTIMVLGKTGVGKSATINSIFDEVKFSSDAFQNGTKKVQDVVGTVQGIKVRVIDTPGLLPSWSDQRQNEKILLSVKRFIKKTPPDIVLYFDRLDMQSRDLGDMPLLRTITEIFGPSIWFNAIVVLTHAASAPPEGPNGTATSYDMFVTQRSHIIQQAIHQAAGDMRLMNPVSLVENHSACRKNRAGQRVLPNGQVWKPHLLLLSFASKILVEANTLLKLQDSPPGKPFAPRTRAPPLPFLLSSLLQSRPQLQLPQEQFGDDDDMLDVDLDDSSDSDDESEYDELPPFKRLTKAQLRELGKCQLEAYHAELDYREKLFMKKQLKEEKRRRKMMKKMAASENELPSEYGDNVEEENGSAASVPVPMSDLALPASFDSDNPTHRYRYLDSPNQWVVRPVLDTHGWDHDIGYEGVNVERHFVAKQRIPVSFSGQITKDKKDANMQMEIASSMKHGEGKTTSLVFDMQTLGKDIAYTLHSETRFCNYKKHKATAGISVTMLGDTLTTGVKIEDKLIVNKRLRVVASGGAMTGRGDVAYGGSFEATLRDKDHPLGRSLLTLGLSVMDWHGDLAIGGNLQSQIPVGRSTNLIARANLNNRSSGQVSIRLNSSEQLQIVLIGLLPLLKKALGYSQLFQLGQ